MGKTNYYLYLSGSKCVQCCNITEDMRWIAIERTVKVTGSIKHANDVRKHLFAKQIKPTNMIHIHLETEVTETGIKINKF